MSTPTASSAAPTLRRDLGLLGLTATGICSMMGAAINVIPFMLQKTVPGIGPWVVPAYALAAVPAVLAALAYAILASAMPRSGGSYIYASRAIGPYVGFVASFSQWFGLSIAIGVVSYVITPFLRDIAEALGWSGVAGALELRPVRLGLALAFLWTFVLVNLRGIDLYERTLIPLMVAMFVLGGVVIVAGFTHTPSDFAAGLLAKDGRVLPPAPAAPWSWAVVLAACPILFSSFIGFDSIAQAGGEAKDPQRLLPRATFLAVGIVGTFYLLFTAAVYHVVPWSFIASEAQQRDLTAPGLFGYFLSPGWTIAIVTGAACALTNDLPAMLLAVSRLMFAWAEDGIMPKRIAAIHARWRTPHVALLLSGGMATCGILGSHFAGSFFLGVDILVTAMLVNFLCMCWSVLALPGRNPAIAREIRVLPQRGLQVVVASTGIVLLALLLAMHTWRDLTAPAAAWYYRSTPMWLVVMAIGTLLYLRERRQQASSGVDLDARFLALPPQ
ncbi:MAG: APC family permease [Gemmatimonadaceae bacterium]|nr:APC family permease [Gemmatimonadaceae bacterium]